jgi:hypothetical protein
MTFGAAIKHLSFLYTIKGALGVVSSIPQLTTIWTFEHAMNQVLCFLSLLSTSPLSTTDKYMMTISVIYPNLSRY